MIIDICSNEPYPINQEGIVKVFHRLTHEDNEIIIVNSFGINTIFLKS